MNILIVDDQPVNIDLLSGMLERESVHLFAASSGNEAIAIVESEDIDLVLLDIMMPGMDGFTTARKIRDIVGYTCYFPIIFVTAVTDIQRLSEGLKWGDDFILKPVSRVILLEKVHKKYNVRRIDKDKISEHKNLVNINRAIEREHTTVQEIFHNVIRHNRVNGDRVKFIVTPMSLFSGDVVLVDSMKDRSVVFVGDFTGHGLAAAMGVIPAAQIFYNAVKKDKSIGDIARETNSSLADYLPPYMFLAGTYVFVDHRTAQVEVWTAAMPRAIITDIKGLFKRYIEPMHLPIGTMTNEEFESTTYNFIAEPGDRLFLCTDGIIEGRNENGEMYGDERFEMHFREESPNLFQHIINSHLEFCAGANQADDVSLVEINLYPI